MNILKYDYNDLKDIKGWINPRDCMIEIFGGAVPLAKALGLSVSTVYRWKDGVIPHKHQYKIIQIMMIKHKHEIQIYGAMIILWDVLVQLIIGKIK